MARNNARPLVAGGTIAPSRFIKLSTSAPETALACGANEQPIIGISQVGTHDPPGVTGSGTQAASAADPVQYFALGDVCDLELGGTVTQGDWIKSGAAGVGITTATTGATLQWIGALALESGVSGELINVQVIIFPYYPALA